MAEPEPALTPALVELNDGRWISSEEARARYIRQNEALRAGRPFDPTGDYGVPPTTYPPPASVWEDEDRPPVSRSCGCAQAKPSGSPCSCKSAPANEAPSPPAPRLWPRSASVGPYSLQEHDQFIARLRDGEAAIGELHGEFARLREAWPTLALSLGKLTREQLLRRMPGYLRASAKKEEMVDKAHNALAMDYVLSGVIGYMGGDTRPLVEIVAPKVLAQTDADLQAYYQRIGRVRAERAAFIERVKAAARDPQTLEDFETFERLRGLDALTAEQRARRDELIAERDRVARKAAPRAELPGGASEFRVRRDLFKGRELFRVSGPRVERDVFDQLATEARARGGRYVARQGFSFFTREAAEGFAVKASDMVGPSPSPAAADEPREQARAQRLADAAASLAAGAQAELTRPRLTNTRRRVGIAAAMEQRAASQDALARSMARIADAVRAGEVKHLRDVSARTHVELLDRLLRETQTWRESQDAKPITLSNVERVEYPWPAMARDDALSLLLRHEKIPGATMAARRLRKYVRAWGTGDVVRFQTPQAIADFETLQKKLAASSDRDAKAEAGRLADRLERWRRLQRMGLASPEALRAALREYLACCFGSAAAPDPVRQALRDLVGTNIPGYFPTPPALAERVAELAELRPGLRVLEPSAGSGELAQALLDAEPGIDLSAIERNLTLRRVLELRRFRLVGDDFLQHAETYDRIVQNPPFEDGQDIDHVRHAFSLLRPGGVLVSIMSAGPTFRTSRKDEAFRAWVRQHGGHWTDNPPGAFKDSSRPTGVATITLVMRKEQA